MSVDFSWDREQLALKRSIIAFAQQELNHDLITKDRNSSFDREAWGKCAEFGLLGLPIPQEYGGMGCDPLSAMLAMEALGYGCHDNGLVFAINNHIWSCAVSILNFGDEALKRAYLPRMCRGELIGCQALTEPEAGSAIFTMQSSATREGDSYILNGTKTFISNAPVADVFIVFCRTEANASQERSLSALLVRKDFPGVRLNKVWDKAGLRTTLMGELVFNDCRVPSDHVLGKPGAGYTVFQSTIEWERSYFFASQVGAMERILERCIAYAKTRKQANQSIGSFQAVAHKIVDMKMRVELAKLLIYKIGWLKKVGRMAFQEASLAKLFISESYIQTCLDAIQIHGARGYLTEYGLERELRDSLAGTIYAGTSEIQRGIIAGILGL